MDNRRAIVTLGIPPSALCGVDLVSFTTTPQFQGIKQVSPGWHFVYTSLTQSLSLRHGTWVYIPSPRSGEPTKRSDRNNESVAVVKKWHAKTEELVDEKDDAVLARLRNNAADIWRSQLTPYRILLGAAPGKDRSGGIDEAAVEERLHDWHVLTDCVTPELLSRVTDDGWNNWRFSSASSAQRDVDEIPGLTSQLDNADDTVESGAAAGGVLHFLPIDLKRTWRSGATGRERTLAAQDRSWALGAIIEDHCLTSRMPPADEVNPQQDEQAQKERYLIGEMQVTFLMILTLANYSCMEHWKRVLSLVLTCREAIVRRPTFFTHILEVLEAQLRHCNDVEGGLFDFNGLDEDGNASSSLLKRLLKTFRRKLGEVASDEAQERRRAHKPESMKRATSTKTEDVSSTANPHQPNLPVPPPTNDIKASQLKPVQDAFNRLEVYLRKELDWDLTDEYVRKGMVRLEDGEEVEMEVDDLQDEDERGEYAPVIVNLDGTHDVGASYDGGVGCHDGSSPDSEENGEA